MGEAILCRTKQKKYQTAVFCFNAFLMPPPPNISTASIGDTGPSWGGGGQGARGVCRLTWAQAAICHPAPASLILILRPARPSRPAVSPPQKGFLLGGGGCGAGGDKGGEELWELGSSTERPFDPVPDRQHRVCSLPPAPPLSLSFISHTDPRG